MRIARSHGLTAGALASALAAVLLLAGLGGREEGPTSPCAARDAPAPVGPGAEVADERPPRLVGRPPPRAEAPLQAAAAGPHPTGAAPWEGTATAAATASPAREGAASDPWGRDDPVDPGAVADAVSAGSRSPLSLARADLLGRVLPYGVLDSEGAGSPRWLGVARLERREDGEAPQDAADPPVTAVVGTIVGPDDAPIGGAEVILYSSFYLRQAQYDHHVREIGRAFTDGDGRFDLRPVAIDTVHFGRHGEVLVTVRHAAYADLVAQRLAGVLPGQESVVGPLRLGTSSVVLSGTVRDLAGGPVADAVVRVSGDMNPVEYDKTERMVVLKDCPAARTDAEGRYVLEDFAPGTHDVSVTIHIDCVLHQTGSWEGAMTWDPRVRAGNAVRGVVLDADGAPLAAAVVAGGGNWTPTNADGTFWLDNVDAGPFTLEVSHHAWQTVRVAGIATNADDVTLCLARRLARVTLEVVDGEDRPVPLIAIDWAWEGAPPRFTPDSRYWHDVAGRFAVTVPEGAARAVVSSAQGTRQLFAAAELADGALLPVRLAPPSPPR